MAPTGNSKPAVLSWRIGAAPSKHKEKEVKPTQTATELPPTSHSREAQRQALVSHQISLPNIREITSSLDPLCRLPCVLAPEDRSLLHSYLLRVPVHVYGTRTDTIFSAVRDVSFPISLGSSITMWWMLIAANGLFTNTGTSDGKMSVVERKHRAYQLLNDALRQSSGQVTDEILGGIIMAAITEARLLDPEATNAHLQGFEGAIRSRGGLRASLLGCAIPALRFAHMMPYLVCGPVQDMGESDQDQLLQFGHFLMFQMRHRGFSPFPTQPSPAADLMQFKNIIVVPELLHSSLSFYLQPDERLFTRFVEEAASFISLFLITLTLWRLSESLLSTQLFVTRLATVLENSSAFDQRGVPLLTTQGFMWVVIKAIQDFQAVYHELSADHGLWPILHGIDALRMYRGMTSFRARKQARQLLLNVLYGQDLSLSTGRIVQ
ncbi:hypothetical protein BJY01DRAFT_122047 [Aspergillus pseudoustus]|uniref:Fungal-specific transcription factor domain-containing protein n=1 Tax=Aspergillus pseudoustus TaxID=1810923 RepID=A0ABR4KFJ1_9EURO